MAVGLLEAGLGLFVLHPQALAATSGLPATAEASPASSFRRRVSGSGAFAVVGGGVRTSKKKIDTTFDYFLHSFPGLFPTCPF